MCSVTDAIDALRARRFRIDTAIQALLDLDDNNLLSAETQRSVATLARLSKLQEAEFASTATPRRATQRRPGPTQQPESVAQDDAIVMALRKRGGVATGRELRTDLKVDDDTAFQQRLTRLRLKGIIGRTGLTWSLTA